MKSSAKKVELVSVDDLFSTEEGRQDAKLEKIQEIPLSELHPFKGHPFKVKDDEAMMETADSVRQYGVLVPAIARPDPEGVDLMPADIQLSGMEVSLVNAMSRETILRQYLATVKGQYSHILIDCQPSLGMLTVNALAAANRIIIPVQAEYLPAKGLEQLLSTINKVKRQLNPKLQIDGILLTMVDNRTNFAREIAALLRETYGSKIKVFGTEIPHSVRAKETSAEGKSIYAHDPGGKVAEGYKNLTKEVLKLEKQREKSRTGIGR